MALIVSGTRVRVVICTYAGGQAALNVRWYDCVGSVGVGGAVTDQNFATQLSALFAADYKALMPATATYRGVSVQVIPPSGPPTAPAVSIANLGAGTAAGDLLPRQMCGVITLRTDYVGRKYRGRVFVAFPAESFNDASGTPTNAYVTALNALGSDLTAIPVIVVGPEQRTMQPMIVHTPSSTPATYVTGYTSRQRWGGQHSRGDYGHPNAPPF